MFCLQSSKVVYALRSYQKNNLLTCLNFVFSKNIMMRNYGLDEAIQYTAVGFSTTHVFFDQSKVHVLAGWCCRQPARQIKWALKMWLFHSLA